MKKLALLSTFLGLLALVFLPTVLKNHGIYLFTYWLIYVIAAMGLNLTVGYAGQKSLGHAAFFGIGAYTVAIMLKAGLSFWLGLPMAALGCFIVGLALGFPALRVQTIYLAFATLGFNTAIWLVMRNEEWLTGGTFGINNITRPEAFGISFDGNLAYYYLVLAFAVVLALLLWGLLRSPWGKAFTALRDNPIRAESLGIDTRGYTLLSFAIGAVYAGIAGGLYASQVQFIDPALFRMFLRLFGTKLRLLDEEVPGIAADKPSNEDFAAYRKVKSWFSKRGSSSPGDDRSLRRPVRATRARLGRSARARRPDGCGRGRSASALPLSRLGEHDQRP